VPDPPVTLDGVSEQVRPVDGEMLLVRATVAVKPLTGDTVIMDVTATPGVVLTIVGLANIWKSWTWTVMVAERTTVPELPETTQV
jgi:hypothetical protein